MQQKRTKWSPRIVLQFILTNCLFCRRRSGQ